MRLVPSHLVTSHLGAIHILRNNVGDALLTDMSNRVEHQKRNQPAIEKWPFSFAFGVQLGLRQTQALLRTKKNKKSTIKSVAARVLRVVHYLVAKKFQDLHIILHGLNQCLCLAKAELNTKNETKRPLLNGR